MLLSHGHPDHFDRGIPRGVPGGRPPSSSRAAWARRARRSSSATSSRSSAGRRLQVAGVGPRSRPGRALDLARRPAGAAGRLRRRRRPAGLLRRRYRTDSMNSARRSPASTWPCCRSGRGVRTSARDTSGPGLPPRSLARRRADRGDPDPLGHALPAPAPPCLVGAPREPGDRFAEYAARLAPETTVHVLRPGQSTVIETRL